MTSYLVQIRDAVVEKFIVLSASIFSGMSARPVRGWDFSKGIFLKSAPETVKATIHYQDTHIRNIQRSQNVCLAKRMVARNLKGIITSA